MYLFLAGGIFVLTACNSGSTDAAATDAATEVATEAAVEEVVEAVGCQVEGGTCLADHSCCAAKEETDHGHDHGHDHSDDSDHNHDHE